MDFVHGSGELRPRGGLSLHVLVGQRLDESGRTLCISSRRALEHANRSIRVWRNRIPASGTPVTTPDLARVRAFVACMYVVPRAAGSWDKGEIPSSTSVRRGSLVGNVDSASASVSRSAIARGEPRGVSTLAGDAIDNGTSLSSARRSPAGSANRWRPVCALGRPVLVLGEGEVSFVEGEHVLRNDGGDISASASVRRSVCARGEPRSASTHAGNAIDNGTSLGSARRSPAGSARWWRPACALGRPVRPIARPHACERIR